MKNRKGRPTGDKAYSRKVRLVHQEAYNTRKRRAYFAAVLAGIRFTEKAGRS